MDQRADVGLVGAAVAQAQLFGGLGQAAEKAVVDLPVQDEPAGGGAALPRRAERAPEHALERQVEIGVVHDDHRVLAAHLEREPLVHAAAGLTDDAIRSRSSR